MMVIVASTLPGIRPGGFRVDKSRSQGLTTWYLPILRVLNSFLALVCPNSNLLDGFWAEDLKKNWPHMGQKPLNAGRWALNTFFWRPPTPP